MPAPIVAGNWKMNTTVKEAVDLATALRNPLDEVTGVEKVVCPPFISLVSVAQVLQGSSVRLGAQNMFYEMKGAFTGEVSPAMLVGICHYVVIGHSERRHILGETDAVINKKMKAAFAAGLRPILCVGETLQQRQAGQAHDVVRKHVGSALEDTTSHRGLVVAYEPVWAIGTGVAADPKSASEIMGVIFRTLATLFGEHAAREVPLLYGGSVTPDNIAAFAKEPFIHGALVGGASLKADQFIAIAKTVAQIKGAA